MKAKKYFLSFLLLSLSLSFFILTQSFLAQPIPEAQADDTLWDMQRQSGMDKIGSEAFGGEVPKDIRVITALVVKVFLGFMGIIFLILIIIAGFKYMTSEGNEEKVKEAVSQIKTSVIGLIIIVTAYAITDYITSCVLDITTGDLMWMCKKRY